jgi:hypothetical protein
MCKKCNNVKFSARRPFSLPMGVIAAEGKPARPLVKRRGFDMLGGRNQGFRMMPASAGGDSDSRIELPND